MTASLVAPRTASAGGSPRRARAARPRALSSPSITVGQRAPAADHRPGPVTAVLPYIGCTRDGRLPDGRLTRPLPRLPPPAEGHTGARRSVNTGAAPRAGDGSRVYPHYPTNRHLSLVSARARSLPIQSTKADRRGLWVRHADTYPQAVTPRLRVRTMRAEMAEVDFGRTKITFKPGLKSRYPKMMHICHTVGGSTLIARACTLRDFARTHRAHAVASCGGRIAWFRLHKHYLNLDIRPKMRHISTKSAVRHS